MSFGGVDAFPLCWPTQWSRTKYPQRARFGTSFARARDDLINEIRLLGGKFPIVSTNIPLKKDGLPYASYREPEDPGVAIYFELFDNRQCVPCDKWNRVVDNLHAINLCVKALRGLERWGAKEMVQASFTGFKALPDYSESVNYFSGCESQEDIRLRYRSLCKENHPDLGGDPGVFSEISKQHTELLKHARLLEK